MDISRLKIIIDEWYQYLDKTDIIELEKDIEMSFKELVIDMLQNIYDEYKDVISYIPVNKDNNLQYILKPKAGKYTLEDFLINRLVRNISMVSYKEQYFSPDSSYDHSTGEILLDKERFTDKLNVFQRRKVVVHEMLHALKTQFVDDNVFQGNRYYALKEKLKLKLPYDINDFSYFQGDEFNGLYSHIGLSRKKELLDMSNMDEIFNDSDAIKFSNDKHKNMCQLDNGLCMLLFNPESSNAFITNYAYIMKLILDKETLFVSEYIDPDVMINMVNYNYNKIFQTKYNSSKTAMEIIVEQINLIKNQPSSQYLQTMLLETFYECINQNDYLNSVSEQVHYTNIRRLCALGLLEIVDGKPKPYSGLSYYNEYNSIRDKKDRLK